jgi:quercetin dioxygenase-like cupin family protein
MANERLAAAYTLGPEEGTSLWFLGTLMTVKAGGKETAGRFTLIEQLLPPGFAPPPHIHHTDDEAFYVLDGSLRVFCGDRTWASGPGAFVFLPREVAHWFTVDSTGPTRLLQLTAPAGFEAFVEAVGERAGEQVLPPPTAPDLEKLVAEARAYGYEILTPPAAPA